MVLSSFVQLVTRSADNRPDSVLSTFIFPPKFEFLKSAQFIVFFGSKIDTKGHFVTRFNWSELDIQKADQIEKNTFRKYKFYDFIDIQKN